MSRGSIVSAVEQRQYVSTQQQRSYFQYHTSKRKAPRSEDIFITSDNADTDQETIENMTDSMQALLLPEEFNKYKVIGLILKQFLNLGDPAAILDTSDESHPDFPNPKIAPMFPNIVLPDTIWLTDDIIIKDVAIKNNILSEVIATIELEFKDSSDNFQDITLNYYEKLLTAYKVYDMPGYRFPTDSSSFNSTFYNPIDEEDEEDEYNIDPYDDKFENGKTLYRTKSNQSLNSIRAFGKRLSSSTTKKKRNLSSINHPDDSPNGKQADNQSPHGKSRPQLTTSKKSQATNRPNSEQGTLNSILSKLRIYNRIKNSRRESLLSMTSNGSSTPTQNNGNGHGNNGSGVAPSGASTYSYSNNNVCPSLPRPNSAYSSYLYSQEESVGTIDQSPSHTPLTREQKLEHRREKHEYYIHLQKVLTLSDKILQRLISSNLVKLIKFLEFIKGKILRFVIIDIMTMIKRYCELYAANFLQA